MGSGGHPFNLSIRVWRVEEPGMPGLELGPELAAELGIGQEGVSRFERRNDTLVSALREAVEAMGGDLRLIAEFSNGGRVELTDIGHA
ncbi:MAG: hypothetical protein OXI66_16310 [Boseongicola sp.]|nr:hypothetical protein [Boseongicola sp.]